MRPAMPPKTLLEESTPARALRESGRVLHSTSFQLTTAVLDTVAAVAAAFVLVSANRPTTGVLLLTALTAIGGIALALAGVYGYQLWKAPYRQRDEALAAVEQASALIAALTTPPSLMSEAQLLIRERGNPLLRLKVTNTGAQPLPAGALINLLYPRAWRTFHGCDAQGLGWIPGGPAQSDEDLPGGVPAMLWMHKTTGTFDPGVSNLLCFVLDADPGPAQIILRIRPALDVTHTIELPQRLAA